MAGLVPAINVFCSWGFGCGCQEQAGRDGICYSGRDRKAGCGGGLSALERAEIMTVRRSIMPRIVLVVPFLLMVSAASAQQGHDACARDVSRFCRAHMSEGDQIVLACLKQN